MGARRPGRDAPRSRGRAWRHRCRAGASALLLLGVAGCDPTSRPGDSLGRQSLARWEWHGRLVVQPDSHVTLVRMTIDTTHGGTDVGLAHYDFTPADGAEYEIALGLDLRQLRQLRQDVPYALGSLTATIPAYATVTCFCRPLKPDSVRGTFVLATRGLRQIAGRVDATLYFTEWTGPARPVTYALHQRIDLVK